MEKKEPKDLGKNAVEITRDPRQGQEMGVSDKIGILLRSAFSLLFHKWLKEKANISLRKDKTNQEKRAESEVGRKNLRNVESIFGNETFSQLEDMICKFVGKQIIPFRR